MPSSTDRIEKNVVINAPRHRVWNALADSQQFGKWFGVKFSAPFESGAVLTGNITNKGYEHIEMSVWVETLEPERQLAFRWHPHAIDTTQDYSAEPTTLVTFTLDDAPDGTILTVVESGFDQIPESRRQAAFTGNSEGWRQQMERVRKYVDANG
jgi:uncharacterized protein YndB with AHSA1/START domain